METPNEFDAKDCEIKEKVINNQTCPHYRGVSLINCTDINASKKEIDDKFKNIYNILYISFITAPDYNVKNNLTDKDLIIKIDEYETGIKVSFNHKYVNFGEIRFNLEYTWGVDLKIVNRIKEKLNIYSIVDMLTLIQNIIRNIKPYSAQLKKELDNWNNKD